MRRAATRVRYNGQEATPEPSKTTRKRQPLIGNGMHSPANATALKCATSIFLIGNEFHLQRARQENPHPLQTALRMGHPATFRRLFAGQPSKRPHRRRTAATRLFTFYALLEF